MQRIVNTAITSTVKQSVSCLRPSADIEYFLLSVPYSQSCFQLHRLTFTLMTYKFPHRILSSFSSFLPSLLPLLCSYSAPSLAQRPPVSRSRVLSLQTGAFEAAIGSVVDRSGSKVRPQSARSCRSIPAYSFLLPCFATTGVWERAHVLVCGRSVSLQAHS